MRYSTSCDGVYFEWTSNSHEEARQVALRYCTGGIIKILGLSDAPAP